MRPGVTLIHGAGQREVEQLFNVVAKLTPNGWVIPDWAADMYEAATAENRRTAIQCQRGVVEPAGTSRQPTREKHK